MEAPETQGKRTWAEISADADQGSTADDGLGDVGDGDVVTLRPQISSKKVVARNCSLPLPRNREFAETYELTNLLITISAIFEELRNIKPQYLYIIYINIYNI